MVTTFAAAGGSSKQLKRAAAGMCTATVLIATTSDGLMDAAMRAIENSAATAETCDSTARRIAQDAKDEAGAARLGKTVARTASSSMYD
eukprot:5090084-Pleurochrysis_carterae.AAC.1